MAKLTTAQRNLGIAAGILGIVQATAWFVMSLLCIIQYNKDTVPESRDSYMDYFNFYVYAHFLYRDASVAEGTMVSPNVFARFMWVYLVLDIVWFLTSACIMILVVRKPKFSLAVVFANWGLITCCLCCVDLILVILIGYDYDQICIVDYKDKNEKIEQEEMCTNAMMPVLVIAARSFVLWILNIIFAFIILVSAVHLSKKVTEKTTVPLPTKSVIDSRIPRPTIQRTPSLYQQQQQIVNVSKDFWNVNLRTAYDYRTPPSTPKSPLSINSSQERFFSNR